MKIIPLKRQTQLYCLLCGTIEMYHQHDTEHPIVSIQEYVKRVKMLDELIIHGIRYGSSRTKVRDFLAVSP